MTSHQRRPLRSRLRPHRSADARAAHSDRKEHHHATCTHTPCPSRRLRAGRDSLKLFTAAQYDALPGMPFPGPPDTYPGKDVVASYLQAYAAAFTVKGASRDRGVRAVAAGHARRARTSKQKLARPRRGQALGTPDVIP